MQARERAARQEAGWTPYILGLMLLCIGPLRPLVWELFKQHHYLSHDLTTSARCYLATLDGQPCAFVSTAPSPGLPWSPFKADPKRAKHHVPGLPRWRESRLVVLPAYQGLGIGNMVSNAVAAAHVRNGHQYFSRTAHPKMVRSRQRSAEWNENVGSGTVRKVTEWPTLKNGKTVSGGLRPKDDTRVGYSFEYIGTPLGDRFHFGEAQKNDITCSSCTVLQPASLAGGGAQARCANCRAPLRGQKRVARKVGWRIAARRKTQRPK